MTTIPTAPWMTAPETVKVMTALGTARFVGGVVRNALLGKPINDIDIATPHEPSKVRALLQAAGIKAVPTGIDHGTITAVVDGKPFEVTTLRRDVETDGRRAVVSFTKDWALDAQRRDFTMNALYADVTGAVFDCVGGVRDLEAGKVRFVGDAVTRIREDYLRILRLFRFHAWYGSGPLDGEAVFAAEKEKAGLASLSGERIAKEMLKLLEAENPFFAVNAMAETGVLKQVVPGEPDLLRLRRMAAADAALGMAPDGILRLATLLPPASSMLAAQVIAARWKLSNAQSARLLDLAAAPDIGVGYRHEDAAKALYHLGPERFADRVRFSVARQTRSDSEWRGLLDLTKTYQRPHFPYSGRDVLAAGIPKGPVIGQILAEVESWWIENGFPSDPAALDAVFQAALTKVR